MYEDIPRQFGVRTGSLFINCSWYYFLLDQIVVIAYVVYGSAAIDFCNLELTEKAEAVREYFICTRVLSLMSYLWNIISLQT
jgi:hypothetical protein